MSNFVISNGLFIIDLTDLNTPSEIVFELTGLLKRENVFGRQICLKLGYLDLTQSQLLSLKSLASSVNSELKCIDCPSLLTQNSAENLGIELFNSENMQEQANDNYNQEQNNNYEPDNRADVFDTWNNPSETNSYNNEENTNQSNDFPFMKYNEAQAPILDESFVKEKLDDFEQSKQNNLNSDDFQNNFSENEYSYQEQNSNDNEIVNNENSEQNNSHDDFQNGYAESFDNNQNNLVNDAESFNDNELEPRLEDFSDSSVSNIENEHVSLLFGEDKHQTFDNNRQNNSDGSYQEALDEIFSEKTNKNIIEEHKEAGIIDFVEDVPEEKTEEDIQIQKMSTYYIKQTVRSGQVIKYDGNVVVIGDCHSGCEIIATGDITVWGVLSRIAHAGSKGNKKARVRALKLNPIQLRIANLYSRRPDSLHTIYNEKTSSFTPEEARIVKDEIIVFTLNE